MRYSFFPAAIKVRKTNNLCIIADFSKDCNRIPKTASEIMLFYNDEMQRPGKTNLR